MRVTILGCSGGIGADLRTTCLLVDDDLLIDAGTGLGDLSLERMTRIRHIFITHSHLDHVAGIPLMADSVFGQVDAPVTLHGQAQTLDALHRHIFNWTIWPDFTRLPTPETPVLRFEPMQPGEVRTIGERSVQMIEVNHVVPGVAYAVQSPTGVFAFSGDTTTNDGLWEALNRYPRLDALMIESAFTDQELELSRRARHYCPSLLAEDLSKLRHRPRIYLSHLKPGVEQRIFEQCRERIRDFDLEWLQNGTLIEV